MSGTVEKGSIRAKPKHQHELLAKNGAPAAVEPVDLGLTWIGGFRLFPSLMVGEMAGIFTLSMNAASLADASSGSGRLQYTHGKYAGTIVSCEANKQGSGPVTSGGSSTSSRSSSRSTWILKVGAFKMTVDPLVEESAGSAHVANGNLHMDTMVGRVKGQLSMAQLAMRDVPLQQFM